MHAHVSVFVVILDLPPIDLPTHLSVQMGAMSRGISIALN
jgi:hypothetical protein